MNTEKNIKPIAINKGLLKLGAGHAHVGTDMGIERAAGDAGRIMPPPSFMTQDTAEDERKYRVRVQEDIHTKYGIPVQSRDHSQQSSPIESSESSVSAHPLLSQLQYLDGADVNLNAQGLSPEAKNKIYNDRLEKQHKKELQMQNELTNSPGNRSTPTPRPV